MSAVAAARVAREALATARSREDGPERLNAFLSFADPASLTVENPDGPLAGVPIAVKDAEMAPILGADGRPLRARGWYDTEALADDGDTMYVGIERVHRIVRFNFGKDGLLARGVPIAVPPAFRSLPHNASLECLAMAPIGGPLGGTLIAVS